MNDLLKILVFGAVSVSLTGCGGKSELGPATSVPKVDQKKVEDEVKRSMEMGKIQGKPPGAPDPEKKQ